MLTIKQYVRAASLEEAYTLNQKRSNVILGGMMWLKMQQRTVHTAIDLCELGLDTIEETAEDFRIGAMVTLRQLELHPALHAYTQGALAESLRPIVGVQFRNCATVGGSLFGRYGFSDVLTLFLALDASVELYGGGRIPLPVFAQMPQERDLLIRVIVKKRPIDVVYLSQRNTKTDFPVLTCAMSRMEDTYTCVIGARPQRAVRVCDGQGLLSGGVTEARAAAFGEYVAQTVTTASNLRASADYRTQLARVLAKRAALRLSAQGGSACR